MPVIRLGAPDGQNKLISVGFDHLEISTALSKLCWLFCFQTIVCSTISRFWDGFRTTYYNNHCSIDNGIMDLEPRNAVKLVVLNFSERIKELHTKCCTARQNRLGLSRKPYAIYVWAPNWPFSKLVLHSDPLFDTKMWSSVGVSIFSRHS